MKLAITRRLLAAATLFCATAGAQAAWPDRPIRIIVPSAAGGSPDILARFIGAELSKRLGQSVVIENRAGAGGNIGMQALVSAPADGYTIAYGNNATLATNEFLFSKLPYDPATLVPIVQLTLTASLLVVNKDLPVKTVPELIAYAKARPNQVFFASGGLGTSGHLGGELFKTEAGISTVHVPYKGGAQAMNDLVGNQVQYMFDNFSSAGPNVQSGAVRALAVTSKARSPNFPDLPTMQEAGIAGFEITAWGALVAAPGTPPEIVARLNKEVNAALQDEKVREQILSTGSTPVGGSPDDLRRQIESERVRWGDIVKKSGAKVD
ncbi:ABC transporter substrate-binding protein [Bordetella genomosp. 5]|uniref:ABC transporter substrate-binding protein n=1 Tax=Bordetella genomosp. 5 TaxID=1395608 RepID=A0A261TBH7_9BORD|nr:tripartite tricarboxylate transporter substrate binding protein [Bordetella genomosp. 5]OZI39881.1 ABC transporter substrate-binding protein [Bordetella genomosp. 5]OZI46637.1 ABC transporter substrate-binding protein [Bordetella genomosp. 5]